MIIFAFRTNNFDSLCSSQLSDRIKNIFDCYSQKIIIIPEFQRLLDLDKVNNMIMRYKKDGESFRFLTNYIQLICIDNNKYLVLDGQHRLNMYEKLVEEKVINDGKIDLYKS